MWLVRARVKLQPQRSGSEVQFVVAHPTVVAVFVLPHNDIIAVVESGERDDIVDLLQRALPEATAIELTEVSHVDACYLRSPT
jgi:hypothetical protein